MKTSENIENQALKDLKKNLKGSMSGGIKKVFDDLQSNYVDTEADISDDIFLAKTRLAQLEKSHNNGVILYDTYERNYNRIAKQLQEEIIDKIEVSDISEEKQKELGITPTEKIIPEVEERILPDIDQSYNQIKSWVTSLLRDFHFKYSCFIPKKDPKKFKLKIDYELYDIEFLMPDSNTIFINFKESYFVASSFKCLNLLERDRFNLNNFQLGENSLIHREVEVKIDVLDFKSIVKQTTPLKYCDILREKDDNRLKFEPLELTELKFKANNNKIRFYEKIFYNPIINEGSLYGMSSGRSITQQVKINRSVRSDFSLLLDHQKAERVKNSIDYLIGNVD